VLYTPAEDGYVYAFTTVVPTPTPTPSPTPSSLGPIFQDSFDSYVPGTLPAGGTNQWTSVNARGAGFGVSVSSAQADSPPNALQFALGTDVKGYAYVRKDYAGTYSSHAARFNLYLDPSFAPNQTISLLTVENRSRTVDGSVALWLAANRTLQVIWYDNAGGRHVLAAPKSSLLALGQWYTLELDQVNDPANGSWSLWLNGSQLLSQSAINLGDVPMNTLLLGDSLSSSKAMAGSFYVDDVDCDTQHIG
jgi:hypothetical protein